MFYDGFSMRTIMDQMWRLGEFRIIILDNVDDYTIRFNDSIDKLTIIW